MFRIIFFVGKFVLFLFGESGGISKRLGRLGELVSTTTPGGLLLEAGSSEGCTGVAD